MDSIRTEPAVIVDAQAGPEDARSAQTPLLRNARPVVLICATFGAVAFTTHLPGADAVVAALMAVVLVVVAATDLESRIIPNRIVLPATAIILTANIVLAPDRALEFVLAAVGAGLVFFIPNLINSSLMGMGDVKLIMLLGAGLGVGVVGAIMVALLSVFPVAVAMLIRGGAGARKATLPFGPFLALGGLVILIIPHLAGLG
jgi:leader peptidase (prepilin peptidase) / N-methyltransferase